MKTDSSYGHKATLDKFFAPWPPENEIGEWYVEGHDANDVYQDFVVVGEWKAEHIPQGWVDWIRTPIRTGNPLLT